MGEVTGGKDHLRRRLCWAEAGELETLGKGLSLKRWVGPRRGAKRKGRSWLLF